MRSIWIKALSLPVAVMVWWVSTGDRRQVVEPEVPQVEVPQVLEWATPGWLVRSNEFDGAPGDLYPRFLAFYFGSAFVAIVIVIVAAVVLFSSGMLEQFEDAGSAAPPAAPPADPPR